MPDRKILTLAELAETLKVSRSTVSRWASAGIIPCIRGPRALRFDLDAALAALNHNHDKEARPTQ